MNKINTIFFAGGYDLEMVEIIKILDERGLNYYDKKLQWGARLSEYKEYFNNTDSFIGIELIDDIPSPPNYINIDHHNDKANLPSSIEQIAQMLDYKLDRWQQLVAANDKGYIPAMITMGANDDEINLIRLADRNAQGVTEEDEMLAEQSIQKNLSVVKGISVVKSLTSKFSPITDRLYPCKSLLIYTDNELTYYGEKSTSLSIAFQKLIIEKKAYSGGGKSGFFGLNPFGIDFFGSSINAVQQIIKTLHHGK